MNVCSNNKQLRRAPCNLSQSLHHFVWTCTVYTEQKEYICVRHACFFYLVYFPCRVRLCMFYGICYACFMAYLGRPVRLGIKSTNHNNNNYYYCYVVYVKKLRYAVYVLQSMLCNLHAVIYVCMFHKKQW